MHTTTYDFNDSIIERGRLYFYRLAKGQLETRGVEVRLHHRLCLRKDMASLALRQGRNLDRPFLFTDVNPARALWVGVTRPDDPCWA
ncbi:hypothetical protein B5K06_27675 [Rhizobium grahamii]|uniref:Uncharacterized protein n=1 Tax=Rhizobium grahamii TaxID=1120045 RepID=A0A370KH12_9HYPH|nr:hypothetical protein B5K06_27675 [Rhizobium grahamii]